MDICRRGFLKVAFVSAAGVGCAGILRATDESNQTEDKMENNASGILVKGTEEFPNNEQLPLVVYKQAFKLGSFGAASEIEKTFLENGWGNNWRNGIYSYHHYHSQAHEFIGVYGGEAKIQFGGPEGPMLKVEKGDALVIPAGVAHKKISSSFGFSVAGAYPPDQYPDMKYGKASERPQADKNIARVALPKNDPIHGSNGPLIKLWNIAQD